MNLIHTGELDYVLYIPSESALLAYSRLWEAGQKYGIMSLNHSESRNSMPIGDMI